MLPARYGALRNQQLEEKLTDYVGIAVSSGTDALLIALMAWGRGLDVLTYPC